MARRSLTVSFSYILISLSREEAGMYSLDEKTLSSLSKPLIFSSFCYVLIHLAKLNQREIISTSFGWGNRGERESSAYNR